MSEIENNDTHAEENSTSNTTSVLVDIPEEIGTTLGQINYTHHANWIATNYHPKTIHELQTSLLPTGALNETFTTWLTDMLTANGVLQKNSRQEVKAGSDAFSNGWVELCNATTIFSSINPKTTYFDKEDIYRFTPFGQLTILNLLWAHYHAHTVKRAENQQKEYIKEKYKKRPQLMVDEEEALDQN